MAIRTYPLVDSKLQLLYFQICGAINSRYDLLQYLETYFTLNSSDASDEIEINSDQVDVLILDLSQFQNPNWENDVSQKCQAFAQNPKIFLIEEAKSRNFDNMVSYLDSMVNNCGAFAIFDANSSRDEVVRALEEAGKISRMDKFTKRKMREIKAQTHNLNDMGKQLGREFKQSHQEWKESKNRERLQMVEMRQLIQFLNNLAGVSDVGELIRVVREGTRRFHQIYEPILAYSTSDHTSRLYHFQAGKLNVRELNSIWPIKVDGDIDEIAIRNYLADALYRPVGPLFTFSLPITRNLESLRMENLSNVASKVRKSDPVQRAIILFEHSLVGEGQLSFLDFIAKRIQPISIVLDQIFFEQDLHSTSYLWEQSFDCIEEPIAIVDREFQLLKANRNFTKSKTGIHCHEAFFESSETCLGCPVKQVIEKGIPHTSLLKKCNHVFQVRSYPIRDARKTGFSGTIVNHYLDVTKAQALRTQVAQSEKMAAVGHLAGHIAHELNNPLTGIRSTAQILLHDRKPGTSLYDDLVEVEKATLRCQNIIRNLLEFSHEGSESVLTLVSLNDVLEKTLPLLKSAMGLFENEIDLTSESTLVKVEPQLLQQVIFNILNNACQAIEGKGKIYISTHLEIEEGLEFVDLRIRDTGRGMALEVQEFIFDPFFTTKAVGQGTGLGLSMSKRVVESFGGKIWVWSQAGEGTEFTVRLPSGRNSA